MVFSAGSAFTGNAKSSMVSKVPFSSFSSRPLSKALAMTRREVLVKNPLQICCHLRSSYFGTREASELRLRLKSKLSLRTTRGVGANAAKGGAASADFAVAAAVVDKQVEEAIVSKRMRARKR